MSEPRCPHGGLWHCHICKSRMSKAAKAFVEEKRKCTTCYDAGVYGSNGLPCPSCNHNNERFLREARERIAELEKERQK